MSSYEMNDRNRVRRLKEKARYDEKSVHAVLEAGLVAHVGLVQDGQPFVIPMIYGRESRTLYLHGATKARIMKLFGTGSPVCVNVTLLDGLVAARSAFNSSMNYRSATLFGAARTVDDETERLRILKIISDHAFPGRWEELRAPLDSEIKQTGVAALTIESASAKIAEGPPDDEDFDYAIPVWAGVLPITSQLGKAQDDPRLLEGVTLSPAIAALEDTRR
jgi:nitroimidazol reductase NimA-like FMN-containing flavoprotein (pyridoxamine 5'-phosphate oxidase superfamily)